MMALLLIGIYGTLFTFCLLKISRSYRNYISTWQVTLSFATKIAFGMAYGFLFLKYYKGDDTWLYHNQSLVEYRHLLLNPSSFFVHGGIKIDGSTSLQSMYDTTGSFWNKFDEVLFIKLLAVFNLFSFGYYYVNVVIFCFVVFIGHLLLFRLLVQYYPKSVSLFRMAIFFNPMVIFWLSGIRKEGILFLAIAVVLFYFDRLTRRRPSLVVNILFSLIGLSVLLLLRNFMFICLAPSLMAWVLCRYFNWKAIVTFSVVYLVCISGFFVSGMIPGFPNLAEKIAQRQHEYLGLVANTRLQLDSLHATPSSFIQVLPQAINHVFLRPYITEAKGILQIFSATDVLLFLMVVAVAILYRRRNWKKVLSNPVLLTCLFTSFFAYLIIGYTVPYPGTFVRYKAIFELLFLCVLASIIDVQKIIHLILIKNNILIFSKKN
jgi:hypothetical protein